MKRLFPSILTVLLSLAFVISTTPSWSAGTLEVTSPNGGDSWKRGETYTIEWDKGNAGMGWQDYRSQHEPILYGWKKGNGKHNFYGDRTQTSVWYLKRDSVANYSHPTQKPVGLMEYMIKTYTNEGESVLDNTMGSGTTGFACLNTSRNFVGIELAEKYYNIAKDRLNNPLLNAL